MEYTVRREYGITTYRQFAMLHDSDFPYCGNIGTRSRLYSLRNRAYADAEFEDWDEPPLIDDAPQCISQKLTARLKEHNIVCFGNSLLLHDIRSFEWLGELSLDQFDEICTRACIDDLVYDRASSLWMEAVHEKKNTLAPAPSGTVSAHGIAAVDMNKPPLFTTHWQRFVMTRLAITEIQRVQQWATVLRDGTTGRFVQWKTNRPNLNLTTCTTYLESAHDDLCCSSNTKEDALEKAFRVFTTLYNLKQTAKTDGWATSVLAGIFRSTIPTLRDTTMWRAVNLVGYTDRDSYLKAFTLISNKGFTKDSPERSQLLMSYETSIGSAYPAAFPSNNTMVAQYRGKPRARRNTHRITQITQHSDEPNLIEADSSGDVSSECPYCKCIPEQETHEPWHSLWSSDSTQPLSDNGLAEWKNVLQAFFHAVRGGTDSRDAGTAFISSDSTAEDWVHLRAILDQLMDLLDRAQDKRNVSVAPHRDTRHRKTYRNGKQGHNKCPLGTNDHNTAENDLPTPSTPQLANLIRI